MDPRISDLISELASRPAKMPRRAAMCFCDHDIVEHNIVKRHSGCDCIGCTCREFKLRPDQETP